MLIAPATVTTARLTLRRPTLDDAAAVFAYAGDPAVVRYMSWPLHSTIEATHQYLERALAGWEQEGVGAYLIERDGAVIGSTGLDLRGERMASTGYVLARAAWGNGYATEACRAMIDLGRSLGFARIEAYCHVDHSASAHVLVKCGMRLEGTLRGKLLFPNLADELQDVRGYALVATQTPQGSQRAWIADRLGAGVFEQLSAGLPGSSLQSILLEVMHRRAAARTPAETLRQFERDLFCRPAAADPRTSTAIDLELFAAAEGFEPVELSPVTPLGTCSAVAPTHQNRVLSALRATEVVADPTNVLALECASRLRAQPAGAVHLAASHRVVRAQPVPRKPGYAQHFRLFVLASGGQELEDHAFTVAALACHIRTMLRALDRLEQRGYAFGSRRVEILATPARRELGARLAGDVGGTATCKELEHAYYSGGLRFTVWVTAPDGTQEQIADGGAFDWLARLTSNRRAVYVASGLGAQLIAARFCTGSPPQTA